MTRRRRQFSPEFKEEAIRMVLEGERTVASVAREFDINASTLGSWVNRHRIVHAQDEQQPVSGPERARIRELERENAELREKLAFLKKQPPSSRPTVDDARQVRADRRGEGASPDRADVCLAGRVPLGLLRVARAAGLGHRATPDAAGRSGCRGLRRLARDLRLPACARRSEMPLVDSGDLAQPETLGDRDDGGVHQAERKIYIPFDKFRHAGKVLVLQFGDVEPVASEGLQEGHLGLRADTRFQQISDLSHHGRGHEQRSLCLTEQLQAGVVVLVLDVARTSNTPGSHKSTSAAHLRTQDLLVPLGQIRLGLERREERQIALCRGGLVQPPANQFQSGP
ncbi:transposase [Nonomuraea africana]|uniref:transposase n=1 Tax=Nonomuraea africana TaxID=46171 RepID=UPI003F4D0C7D